ncbi:Na(+)/H(+) exchange regulatory cofactor NHE-RF2 [Liparis tanakae]|uniref:Na(+)/H(+) exchange regulatory cofactor NHE-RF2 n=1 Tax=Liparis tanakae TaxID=230148 RepID=A0A4Z2HUR7_9TELE|nr:Na(+)/H(+) exchange regulatory cofactor NHE-RF2 [Liparis tanakae]
MESELRPRLCFLTRGECSYGFHLHGERNRGGQFIRKVEPGSSADQGGLRSEDRLVEVNGENVEKETHHQRIREVAHRTRLLVVDAETDEYLRSRGLACTEDLAVEMGTLSPRPSPGPTPSASPVPRENSPLAPKPNYTHSVYPPAAADSTTDATATQAEVERTSVTSSTETDSEVHPSPEQTAEPLPRLCHLVKGEHGYGFNLHSNKTKDAQFVRSVDPGSAAERGDVRPGDRLVEVNGVNIGGLRHSEVVALIRAQGEEVHILLVHDEDERRVSDPLVDAGLRLSLTAAEAKQKALATRNKRRAPAMDWRGHRVTEEDEVLSEQRKRRGVNSEPRSICGPRTPSLKRLTCTTPPGFTPIIMQIPRKAESFSSLSRMFRRDVHLPHAKSTNQQSIRVDAVAS